jgi:hypothetical protein
MFKERYDCIGMVKNGRLNQTYEFSGRGGNMVFYLCLQKSENPDSFFHFPFSKSVFL